MSQWYLIPRIRARLKRLGYRDISFKLVDDEHYFVHAVDPFFHRFLDCVVSRLDLIQWDNDQHVTPG